MATENDLHPSIKALMSKIGMPATKNNGMCLFAFLSSIQSEEKYTTTENGITVTRKGGPGGCIVSIKANTRLTQEQLILTSNTLESLKDEKTLHQKIMQAISTDAE